MAGGIKDVDLHTVVEHSGVLTRNGNAALPLDRTGVHDPVHDSLIGAEHTALAKQAIHQGRLAVVDVGDNRNVTYVFSLLNHKNLVLTDKTNPDKSRKSRALPCLNHFKPIHFSIGITVLQENRIFPEICLQMKL